MPWTLLTRDGSGLASPSLRMLAGPHQHFKSAGILAARKGFRGGPLLEFEGTKQLLFSAHLRERDKMLLRSILCGGTWNGFLLGKSEEEDVLCRFCGCSDGDGLCFGRIAHFSSVVQIREHLELAS